jgi:hypothetical protein
MSVSEKYLQLSVPEVEKVGNPWHGRLIYESIAVTVRELT